MSVSDHWLWRLNEQAWLAAARTELVAALARSDSRRSCLTHIRRAAGMALNAVLVHCFSEDDASHVWGRSYIDHLRSVGSTAEIPRQLAAELPPEELRLLCVFLLETPLMPGASEGQLITLRPKVGASATELCLGKCEQIVDACERSCRSNPALE